VVGGFVTAKGKTGTLKLVITIWLDDMFVKVSDVETVDPAIGCNPKSTSSGERVSVAVDVNP
jgi:hypothetical protein